MTAPVLQGPAEARDSKLAGYIRFLEQTLHTQPPTADVHTLLGMAHMLKGDVYQAVQSLETAVALDGEHFFARFRYADLLFRMGATRQAEASAKRALSLARSPSEWRMAKEQVQKIRQSVGRITAGLPLSHSSLGDHRWSLLTALLSLVATLCSRFH